MFIGYITKYCSVLKCHMTIEIIYFRIHILLYSPPQLLYYYVIYLITITCR